MKVAPLLKCLRRCSDVSPLLVHTGQHYDPEMSEAFFQDLGLPQPDIHLGIGSGSHADQTARIMIAFEKVLVEEQPDAVVVVGDVNSTLACSLVAAKMTYSKKLSPQINTKYPVDRPLLAHVEAGLRSDLAPTPWPRLWQTSPNQFRGHIRLPAHPYRPIFQTVQSGR